MLHTDASNTVFKLAADFIHNTSRHIFLTGKAGTGKTTFLKYIKEHTSKHAVVVAPTGVAAINAGGVTMHSFFQLPFGPFIPGDQRGFMNNSDNISDKHSLFKNIRFSGEKRELLQELELLIIDEISMVRADMLDAMDAILRHFRKKYDRPFGGVQVLYIGDMYQLPPVVPNNEWDILQPYYESPFFFSSKVVAEAPPLYIELKKIYRQNEQLFIDVLNRVRNNQAGKEDLFLLNSRYRPAFTAPEGEKYITLSTHNKKADSINTAALNQLPGKLITFSGSVTGEFSDKAFPTERSLELKEGAQVMFIKNDSGTDRKFYNGKLATIKKITPDEIIVSGYIDNEEMKVEKETWRNIRYNLNKETNRIEEEELGSFTQYPLRLAWAITIHKSQGLTFDKAIIDAGASFAAGQVYVALSRCTSLDGMILMSMLYPSAIATDERVIAFARKESASEELEQILKQEEKRYWSECLVNNFHWAKVTDAVELFREQSAGKKLPDPKAATNLRASLFHKSNEQAMVAAKFQQQLRQLLPQVQQTGEVQPLHERVNKAIAYFIKSLFDDFIAPLQQHVDTLQHAPKLKKHIQEVAAVLQTLREQQLALIQSCYGEHVFCDDAAVYDQYLKLATPEFASPGLKKGKTVKGSSQEETLSLFKNGKTVSEIAALRQLAATTITGHLSMFVRTGELHVRELLTDEKIQAILPVVKEMDADAIGSVKEILGDAFSYADIRVAMNHWHWLQQQKVNA